MLLPLYPTPLLLFLVLLLNQGLLVSCQGQIITVEVDDTDANIKYSSGWFLSSQKSEAIFDGTEHLSRIKGGTANFTFIGIGVSVFGSVVPLSTFAGSLTKSTYFFDDQPGQSYTAPENITETQNRVLFYQSPVVPNGTHILSIVNDNDDDWYFLDFLEILSDSPSGSLNGSTFTNGSSTIVSSNVLASSHSSPEMTTTRASSSNEVSPVPASLISHGQKVSPGIAVGIAFGSAVVLVITVAFTIFLCQRRSRRQIDLARLVEIDPFVNGFVAATNDRKDNLSPPASPAAVETSAHGMFHPYSIEFFSRSRPHSFKSLISPSRKSARSAKLNVSPMSQATPSQPTLRPLPTHPPVSIQIPARRNTRRSSKYSLFTNLSLGGRGREEISPTSPTDIQMGIAM